MHVSVLIPLYNRLDLTRACLDSLVSTMPRGLRWEALLVDDGSTDGTRQFLAGLPADGPFRVVLNAERRGFAANNNLGARLARAEVLCLLNNDTVLMPGWLEPMLAALRAGHRAGLVSNVQREPFSGLIDHAGIVFNRQGLPVHVGKDACAPPREGRSRWPAVTAACCLVRRRLFLELGGFDETFRNGFEDVDLCLRAGERGYRHYVANESFIYHHLSASPGRKEHEAANRQQFRRRWGKRLVAWRRRTRRTLVRRWLATHARSPRPDWLTWWEAARETRRQLRQNVVDQQLDGWRYLRKHWWRPWRYNHARVCAALEKVVAPTPRLLGPCLANRTRSGPLGRGFRASLVDLNGEPGLPRPPGGYALFDLHDKWRSLRPRHGPDAEADPGVAGPPSGPGPGELATSTLPRP